MNKSHSRNFLQSESKNANKFRIFLARYWPRSPVQKLLTETGFWASVNGSPRTSPKIISIENANILGTGTLRKGIRDWTNFHGTPRFPGDRVEGSPFPVICDLRPIAVLPIRLHHIGPARKCRNTPPPLPEMKFVFRFYLQNMPKFLIFFCIRV